MSTVVARPSWDEVMYTLDELREHTGLTNEEVAEIIGKDPRQGLTGWTDVEYSRLRDLERFKRAFVSFKPNPAEARVWLRAENGGLCGHAPVELLTGSHRERVALIDRIQATVEAAVAS